MHKHVIMLKIQFYLSTLLPKMNWKKKQTKKNMEAKAKAKLTSTQRNSETWERIKNKQNKNADGSL